MRHTHDDAGAADWPVIAPDMIDSLAEAREIVRGLIPAAGHDEAESMAWGLWQRASSGGWRA